MTRPVYVYRLVVEIPEGIGWANPPEAWLDYQADIDYGPEESPHFSWPQRRRFLTKAPADRMAERLRSYGATVTVERSLPVRWAES